jgi:hypothetical protein
MNFCQEEQKEERKTEKGKRSKIEPSEICFAFHGSGD